MNHTQRNREPMQPERKTNTFTGVLLGLALTVLLHFLSWVVQLFVPIFYAELFFPSFGLTQLLYMVPAIVYFRYQEQRGVMIGLFIGATLTFLASVSFVLIKLKG